MCYLPAQPSTHSSFYDRCPFNSVSSRSAAAADAEDVDLKSASKSALKAAKAHNPSFAARIKGVGGFRGGGVLLGLGVSVGGVGVGSAGVGGFVMEIPKGIGHTQFWLP